jgi:hypothetical protein
MAFVIPVLVVIFSSLSAKAQAQPDNTRAAEVEVAVAAKEGKLVPEKKDRLEALIGQINDKVFEAFFTTAAGPKVKIGGLANGSGFALGPSYRRYDLAGERVQFDTFLVGSVKQFYAGQARLRFPRIAGRRFDAELLARYANSPSLIYFGPGSNSARANKTAYRREDTELKFRLGWRPDRQHLMLGYEAMLLQLNTGPGPNNEWRSTERVFSPAQTPGVDVQAHYWGAGPFVQLDYRDRPGDPHKGVNYRAQMMGHWDYTSHRYSFQRVQFSAEHYVPFWNQKRVIALRAKTDLSYVSPINRVPFYLQPTLGGPDDLRGFQRWRYYDNNASVANLEYRWEVSTMLDMALFADAGNVFARPGLIGFRGIKKDAGLGFRLKTRDAVFMRLDAGVSKEGVQVWFVFSNIF